MNDIEEYAKYYHRDTFDLWLERVANLIKTLIKL